MSRVERTENPTKRRGSEHLRQAQRGRQQPPAERRDSGAGHTPTKAEGELGDIEEALEKSEN